MNPEVETNIFLINCYILPITNTGNTKTSIFLNNIGWKNISQLQYCEENITYLLMFGKYDSGWKVHTLKCCSCLGPVTRLIKLKAVDQRRSIRRLSNSQKRIHKYSKQTAATIMYWLRLSALWEDPLSWETEATVTSILII